VPYSHIQVDRCFRGAYCSVIRMINKPHGRIAGYIGVGGPRKLGLTNGEWVTTGEESGQWQLGRGRSIEKRGRYSVRMIG
jgi:hypothetical protein